MAYTDVGNEYYPNYIVKGLLVLQAMIGTSNQNRVYPAPMSQSVGLYGPTGITFPWGYLDVVQFPFSALYTPLYINQPSLNLFESYWNTYNTNSVADLATAQAALAQAIDKLYTYKVL